MTEAKNPIQSVQRSLEIIDILQKTGGANISEIADGVGITDGSTHSHLATLNENGYVVKDGNQYKLGLRFVELAHHVKDRIEVDDIATSEVDKLAEKSGERALFTVEEGGKGICLHTAEGAEAVQTEVYVGYRNQLYHTAVGKAMLAVMPEAKRDRIIEQTEFEAKTSRTITDEAELRTELEEIRQEGIAYNYGESIQGLVGVGAPIQAQDGTLHGAISVIGPVRRLDEDRLEGEIPDMIREAVNIIEINVTSI